MRRLTSILIVTGAVLTVAQAAVAELVPVPITVTSQTLLVTGPNGDNTGEIVGGSSVGTSWNLGLHQGSTVGTVSSVLTDGELIFTIAGSLSKSDASASSVFVVTGLEFSFGFSVPDIGESTTSIFFQVLRTTNELTGTVKQDVFSSTLGPEGTPVNRGYSSQLVGGLVAIGYGDARGFLGVGATSVTHDAQHFIPTDTVTLDSWIFRQAVFVSVDNSTGTFSETYTFRALTPTPVPEPTSSLTIPSGAAMLLALAKLRSVSLIH